MHLRSWRPAMACAAMAASLLCFASAASAQDGAPQQETPPPKVEEVVFFVPSDAPTLTPQRSWSIGDGTSVEGQLVNWTDNGLIAFRNRHGRSKTMPLRALTAEHQAAITEVLRPTQELLERLEAVRPLRNIKALDASGVALPHSQPLDLQGDQLYVRHSRGISRISLGGLEPGVAEAVRAAFADRGEPWQRWDLWKSWLPLHAKLVGEADDDFIFQDVGSQRFPQYRSVTFRLLKSALAPSARDAADAKLKAMGNEPTRDGRKNTPYRLWMAGHTLHGPGIAKQINDGTLVIEDPLGRPIEVPLAQLEPDHELAARMLLAVQHMKRQEGQSATQWQEAIAQARSEAYRSAIASDPLRYLSHDQWRFKDAHSGSVLLLLGVSGNDFVFQEQHSDVRTAIGREELESNSQSLAEALSQRIAEYYQANPEASAPRLQADYRVIRTNSGGLFPAAKVVGLKNAQTVNLQRGDGTPFSLPLDQLHFVDRRVFSDILQPAPAPKGPSYTQQELRQQNEQRARARQEAIVRQQEMARQEERAIVQGDAPPREAAEPLAQRLGNAEEKDRKLLEGAPQLPASLGVALGPGLKLVTRPGEAWTTEDDKVLFATFVAYDGEDVIMRAKAGYLFRIYRFVFKEEAMEEMNALARQSPPQQGEPDAVVEPAEVTLRVLRGVEGIVGRKPVFVGPLKPLGVLEGHYVGERPDGVQGSVPLDEIHPRDLGEIRGQLHRAATGIARDEHVDERLRREVAAIPKLSKVPPLADNWRTALDAIRQPVAQPWQQTKLPVGSDQEVLAVSDGGRQIIVKGRSVELLDMASGERLALPFADTAGTENVFFDSQRHAVWGHDGEAFVQWDVQRRQAVRVIAESGEPPVAACLSADAAVLFLLAADGRLTVAPLDDKNRSMLHGNLKRNLSPKARIVAAPDGRAAMVADDQLVMLVAVDAETSELRVADYPLTPGSTDQRWMIALSTQASVLALPSKPAAIVLPLGAANRNFMYPIFGLRSVLLQGTTFEGAFGFQCFGTRDVPGSEAADYLFAVQMNVYGRPLYPAQSIDGPVGTRFRCSASGDVLVQQNRNGWFLAKRPPLRPSLDRQIAAITEPLVEQHELGQIEACYQYLRNEPFHHVGAYPDEAAEKFVAYLYSDVMDFGWQHGGDLKARGARLLELWNERFPASQLIPLMIAQHQRDQAWRARGSGFADTVSNEGAEAFQNRMRQMADLLAPVIAAPDPPTRAYQLAFDALMSLSAQRSSAYRLANQMMQTRVRRSVTAHQAVALLLLPRWNGEPGDCERYLSDAADAIGGAEGDELYTQLVAYLAHYYPRSQPLTAHLQLDLDRSLRGLAAFYRQRHDPDLMEQMLSICAASQRWDLYRQAMEIRRQQRIYQTQQTGVRYAALLANEAQAYPPGENSRSAPE